VTKADLNRRAADIVAAGDPEIVTALALRDIVSLLPGLCLASLYVLFVSCIRRHIRASCTAMTDPAYMTMRLLVQVIERVMFCDDSFCA
jgi:hypothetical protein